MVALVTGLSGFVGSFVGEQLDCLPLELMGQSVDVTNPGAMQDALAAARPDVVIHLAAQSSVSAAFDDPMETYRVNVLGTLNLLQALRAIGFRGRMLYVSSGDVYGLVPEHKLPIDERLEPQPRNPYAASKLAAEALCQQWGRTGPLDIVIARPFNHIGRRQDTRFAVADFARQIVRVALGRSPPALMVGNIDATRDFTDVRDVVRAYSCLLEHGHPGQIYNVCSNVERSLRSIIEMMSELAQTEVRCTVQSERLRLAEQQRMRGSFDKLRAHTNWTPQIPFRQTLGEIVKYWESKEST